MGAAGDPIDEHGGAGGLIAVLEELVVDLVSRFQVVVLVEKDVAHDDVTEVQPGLLEGRLDIPHRLANLLLERGGVAAIGKLVPLTRDVKRIARQNSWTERQAGGRVADAFLPREI